MYTLGNIGIKNKANEGEFQEKIKDVFLVL